MAFYVPIGTLVRQPGDWFVSTMQTGTYQALALAGSFGQCMVYNGANDGSYLWVYGLDGRCAAGGLVLCGIAPVAAAPAGMQQGWMSVPTAPVGPGFTIGDYVTNLGQVPQNFYLYGDSAGIFSWNYPWPIAIIPPSGIFSVASAQVDTTLWCTFWWINVTGGLAN